MTVIHNIDFAFFHVIVEVYANCISANEFGL